MSEEPRLFDAGAFARNLRVAIAARNIDMRTAAIEIRCSHSTVSRVCNGKSPDVENYLRIVNWIASQALTPSTHRPLQQRTDR